MSETGDIFRSGPTQYQPLPCLNDQALQGLPLKAIQTMKSYASPPAAIMRVCVPLLMMLASEFNAKKHSWDNAKKMMANPKEFLFNH